MEILRQLTKLEEEAAYGSLVIQIEGGEIVRVRLERSAKTTEELARFG